MSSKVVVEGKKPDGNYTPLATDSNGNLMVVGSLGGGAEAVQISDGVNSATITDVSGKKSLDVNVTDITLNYANDSVTSYSPEYKTIVDEASTTITYVGKAVAGSATSASVWQVSKYTVSGNTLVQTTADGDFLFNNVFDNRASLTYS
jgi:hypothetical protein